MVAAKEMRGHAGNKSKPGRRVAPQALRMRWLAYAILILMTISGIVEGQPDGIAELLEARQYREAIRLLDKLAASTGDIDQLAVIYDQLAGIHYGYTHEYAKALKLYDKIIQLSAKGPVTDNLFLAYVMKGDVYCRMGQHQKAIQTYQILVDQFPATHFAHKTGLRKIRSIQTALDDLRDQQRVIEKYQGTPLAIEAEFHIAELYRSNHQLNQPEKAITIYEDILEQDEDTKLAAEAQWRIGNLRDTVLNQPEEGIAAYEKVVENYPTSNYAAEALFRIGRIHRSQKRYASAVQIFEQLTRRYPDFWNMHAVFYWSGVCYERLGDYHRAINALNTFLYAYLPDLDPIYFGAIGRYSQSAAQIEAELKEKIQQLQSDLPKVKWERITALLAEENYIEALPLVRQLIVDRPDTEDAKRAKSQLRAIELHAAIQQLRTANPAHVAYAQFRIGRIYERELKNYKQALVEYRQLIETYPESSWAAEALYRSGLIYTEHLDSTETAIQHYQLLIQRYPTSSQTMMAHFQLGEIYRSLHRYDEALKAYQTTIAYPKRDQYLADGYKDSFADQAQFRIGRVHYEDQRYDDAFAAFQEFIESQTHSPRLAAAYIYLGYISQERGARRQALEAYNKAMSLVIGSPIQGEMVLNEVHRDLGFEGTEPKIVIQRLDELRNRVSRE